MIRNAKPGDIVWTAYGRGPKAEVLEKRNLRSKKLRWQVRGIYYRVRILEDKGIWSYGTVADLRAMTLSRTQYQGPPPKELQFGR